jgi:hypothetical protein
MGSSSKAKKMALTEYQIAILRLLSKRRIQDGISYIAGGAALNKALNTPRLSHDIDVFHDTSEALVASWTSDRQCLEHAGYSVWIIREVPSFVEASICRHNDSVLIQWVRDSAFRFFPLIEDDVLGLTLHPFDLATNKVCALASRLEPRDWIDTIECHRSLLPLGYLIWAACGKDPGLSPEMLLNAAGRMHYSQTELDLLDFESASPSGAQLSAEWKEAISTAKDIVEALPPEHIGKCLLAKNQELFAGTSKQLHEELSAQTIIFHSGSIGGAWPQVVRR